MPIRRITLTPELNAFVEMMVSDGGYPQASDVVSDALRLLLQRRRGERRKLERLREKVAIGSDALEQGDFVELADAELEGCLKRPRTG